MTSKYKHIEDFVSVSVLTGEGLDQLRSLLKEEIESIAGGDFVSINQRQFELNQKILKSLKESKNYLNSGEESFTPDVLSYHVKQGIESIQGYLGKNVDRDVLQSVFSQFCIGK